ncbi:MAG: ABC transporter substrate-binding protein [Nitrospirae bacterium]|nr:MAG: ABC transporter substrate-binding protein [Nitrospirota bacterium]
MKRFCSLLLALVIVLSIVSCKRTEGPEFVTIHFVTWKPNVPEVWDEIFRRFSEQHPEIKVVVEIGPHSSTAFHDLLTQKLKNRSEDVDVFLMDVVWPAEFASAGWAMPLDGLFPEEEQKLYLEPVIEANKYRGRIYGLPLFIDSGMLYYRKDLLERYGFSPPETWQELIRQAEIIVREEKKKGNTIYGYSGQFKQYEGLVCDMMEFILSNNGWILNPETEEPEILKEPALEAVRFVRDRIIGHIAPLGVLTYQEPESLDLFVQGKAVFHRNWPYAWRISNDERKSKIAHRVGIARLPHFPGGRSFSTLGGWQVGISAFTKHREEAWKFASFLSSREVQKLIALMAGKAPTRKSLYEDREIIEANPQFVEMKDVFIRAYPRPKTPLYPAISNVLQRYFSSALSKKDSDIPSLAREAEKEIRSILELAEVKR